MQNTCMHFHFLRLCIYYRADPLRAKGRCPLQTRSASKGAIFAAAQTAGIFR